MKYECLEYSPEHYATALRKDGRTQKLYWDNAKGQDVIIVQTLYGVDAMPLLKDLCQALNEQQPSLLDYVEVMDDVWVCYVSAGDKIRNNGCHLHGEACTYTVFSCDVEEGMFRIYEAQNQCMISPSCNIPLEMKATVNKLTAQKSGFGIFNFTKGGREEKGFYTINFPNGLPDGYMNGSIIYRVQNLEIPVTREMLENKVIYIQSVDKPELVARNKGLRIIE